MTFKLSYKLSPAFSDNSHKRLKINKYIHIEYIQEEYLERTT